MIFFSYIINAINIINGILLIKNIITILKLYEWLFPMYECSVSM